MSRRRFGLDVGRGSVKILGLKQQGGGPPLVALEPVGAEGATGEALRDAQVRAIKKAAAEVGLKRGAQVAVAFPLSDAVLRSERVPDMSPAEAAGFAELRASAELPVDGREVVHAHALSGAVVDGMRRLFIAVARKEKVEHLLALVRDAGLRPQSLEVSADALKRAWLATRPAADALSDALLLDVGMHTTSLVVLAEGEIALSRSIAIGTVSKGDGLVEALAAEVQRSCRAARRELPDRILVGGAAAMVPGLLDALGERLSASPEVLDGLAGLAAPASAVAGPLFPTARGLAEEQADAPKLDFLGEREAADAARRKQRLLTAAAAVAITVGGLLALGWQTMTAREARVAELRAQLAELQPVVGRVRQVASELNRATGWHDKKGLELELLGAFVDALPERAYLTSFQWSEGRAVKISGRAADAELVAGIIASLERSPLVARASFDQMTQKAEKNAGVEFAITAHLAADERGARP